MAHDGVKVARRIATRIVPVGVAALVAVFLFAGCHVDVEGSCCTTQAACDRPRGGGVIKPCEKAGEWCDNGGEYGDSRICIPTPTGRCTTAADCGDGLVECVDSYCVEFDCESNANCSPMKPACNPTTRTCEPCTSDEVCEALSGGTPLCDLDSGTCVECVDATDCDTASPVCAAGACRGCREDAECVSDVCDEAIGVCADPASIIYVAKNGVATGSCTQAQPCSTIQQGVSQVSMSRQIIKVGPGTYDEQVTLDGVIATILGDGVVVQPSGVPGFVVQDGAQVVLEGVRVTGAQGGSDPPGVQCRVAEAGEPKLSMRRVTLDNNSVGVSATNCSLTIEGSTISANGAGGIVISAGTFSLVNNVIAGNGGATSTFGGVSFAQIASGSHRFEFNTVTANAGIAGARTGVDCLQVFIPLTFTSNIVYENTVAGTGTQVGGENCSWTYSDIGPETVDGTGNINSDPLFVDSANGDYHLQASSPAKNAADPKATVAVDIDGDARPNGLRADQGADEVIE